MVTEWWFLCSGRAKGNTPSGLSLKKVLFIAAADFSWAQVSGLVQRSVRHFSGTSGDGETLWEQKMAECHPGTRMKPLPRSWLPLMTPVNFGLFWQLDFEMLGRSPGLDKQPVSSSEKHLQTQLREASARFLVDKCERPKGQKDAKKP